MKKVEVVDILLRIDERGWVAWPIEESDLQNHLISHFHVPCLAPGAIRGNHYHLKSIEFALVLSGPCLAVFEDNETGEREEVLVEGNKPVLFKIAPDTTHAYKNVSDKNIYLLCFEKHDAESDTPDSYGKQILS